MPDIIDLSAERDRRNGPDAQFVTTDDAGRQMFAFCLEYRIGEASFVVSVFACDFDDAERRCAGMRESLVVAGQIYAEV